MKKIKKTKKCQCGEVLGAKTRTCPKCSHKFTFNKQIIGGKKCPSCTYLLTKNARKCKKCKYEYPKKSKRFEEIKEWKKLARGDTFFLRKGSKGPYYKDGENVLLMAERGIFIVKHIQEEGIVAYSQSTGFAYIYMGPTKFITDTGIYRRRYRLFRKVK